MPHYLLRRNDKHEHCVELRDPDGAVLLDCMTFDGKAEALGRITLVRALTPFDSRYHRTNHSTNACSFDLIDFTEGTVARGAPHPAAPQRDAAIAACRQYGPVARVVEETASGRAAPRA